MPNLTGRARHEYQTRHSYLLRSQRGGHAAVNPDVRRSDEARVRRCQECDDAGDLSSSTPNRPSGTRLAISALNWFKSAGGNPSLANEALSIGPGLTEFTRMFRGAS